MFTSLWFLIKDLPLPISGFRNPYYTLVQIIEIENSWEYIS